MEELKDEITNAALTNDEMPQVTGIGGIFFFSDNVQEAKKWYAENLGLKFTDWGSSSFESRNLNDPEKTDTLEWCLFKRESEHFAPSTKEFMINYRVNNLEGLVNKLKENGVTIVDKIQTFDYGKFVHIMDLEGNKIELWEPVD